MRNNARARLERQDGRAQLQVDLLQQIQGDHGGRCQVGLEQVLLPKLHLVGHARLARIGLALLDQRGVNFDPQAGRLKALGCKNDDASVARTQINHMVAALDASHAQHLQRHVVGGGDEGNFFTQMGLRHWVIAQHRAQQYP